VMGRVLGRHPAQDGEAARGRHRDDAVPADRAVLHPARVAIKHNTHASTLGNPSYTHTQSQAAAGTAPGSSGCGSSRATAQADLRLGGTHEHTGNSQPRLHQTGKEGRRDRSAPSMRSRYSISSSRRRRRRRRGRGKQGQEGHRRRTAWGHSALVLHTSTRTSQPTEQLLLLPRLSGRRCRVCAGLVGVSPSASLRRRSATPRLASMAAGCAGLRPRARLVQRGGAAAAGG
jgi:hypothetical protein